MRAGELRQRVTIQIPSRSKNAFDEWVDSWSDWATVWAAIVPNSGIPIIYLISRSSSGIQSGFLSFGEVIGADDNVGDDAFETTAIARVSYITYNKVCSVTKGGGIRIGDWSPTIYNPAHSVS